MGTPLGPAGNMKYLVALSLLCSVLAQETFYCPDGWHLYDGRGGCDCFWLAEYEMVTRDDADVLCSFHKTVEWFDWADGQPNNLNGQNCLAVTEFHNPFIPVFRDFLWNDVDCDTPHHYVCQKTCAAF